MNALRTAMLALNVLCTELSYYELALLEIVGWWPTQAFGSLMGQWDTSTQPSRRVFVLVADGAVASWVR